MWPLFPRKSPKRTTTPSPPADVGRRRKIKIPPHFQKHPLVTYSHTEIQRELRKYPGLLRTLAHAYQYQVTFAAEGKETQYWFCRNLKTATVLIQYLHDKQWHIQWQEKPFKLKS
ncbi:MAG: hypothetical protein NZ901_10985 [Geminocystis sp.]|nr:hypothetical protein [Geminocystis sp.]HIK38166.1 hypothetical protein [Geminocystis sp. M7585_C2015_104]MCS7148696.1 hypothetical protein [Geminocystis sp.]MCX8078226.1 hypothetical protein [Geminocystis sp.]MDW8115112.1 hypothetical protein [Geminocystis sp.]